MFTRLINRVATKRRFTEKTWKTSSKVYKIGAVYVGGVMGSTILGLGVGLVVGIKASESDPPIKKPLTVIQGTLFFGARGAFLGIIWPVYLPWVLWCVYKEKHNSH